MFANFCENYLNFPKPNNLLVLSNHYSILFSISFLIIELFRFNFLNALKTPKKRNSKEDSAFDASAEHQFTQEFKVPQIRTSSAKAARQLNAIENEVGIDRRTPATSCKRRYDAP